MNKLIIAFVLLVSLLFFNQVDARTIKVKSYFKPSTGTYVNSYYKTSPNKTKLDNYSTKNNYNPYSGKKGYVNPYKY